VTTTAHLFSNDTTAVLLVRSSPLMLACTKQYYLIKAHHVKYFDCTKVDNMLNVFEIRGAKMLGVFLMAMHVNDG